MPQEAEPIRAQGEVIPPDATNESDHPESHSPVNLALAIAVIADLLQILVFPLFAGGAFSPLDDVLDVVVGLTMLKLVGWHWAFLPSFVAKIVPFADEVPCWTLAVLYVKATERGKLHTEHPAV